MEDDLQPPSRIAANLAACNLAIVRNADLVGNILLGKLLLSLADEADLGNGVDTVWIEARVGDDAVIAKCTRRGDPALLHRNRSQRGEPNHVAHGKDSRRLGAEVLIHGNSAASIGLNSGIRQVQLIHIALPPNRIEQRIPLQLLLGLQVRDDEALALLHRFHLFPHAHGHPRIAQVIAQRFHDLLVGKLQQPRTPLDQRHAHAQRGEHATVLNSNHSATDDDHRLR